MNEQNGRRQGGVVGPLILISLGVILLLNNLGLLDWTVWEILLRLWPLLLVAAGLDLILGQRSAWGSLLTVVLTFAVLAVALWLSQSQVGTGGAVMTEELVQPLGEARQAKITVDPGVGILRIQAATHGRNLVEGKVRLGRREELAREFSTQGSTAVYALSSQSTSFGPFVVGWAGRRVWDLELGPDIPLSLRANVGLGEADLDLTGLTVESLDLDLGIGQALVILPEDGAGEVKVEGAIGQTVVVIPETLAVKARLDTGIAAREIPSDYDCDEDVCVSPGYEAADERVELDVSQAIGRLVLRH